MDELVSLTIGELQKGFALGRFSPEDVLDASLAHAHAVNPAINAIAWQDIDGARIAARASARRWKKNAPLSAIDGVPVTLKETIAMVGSPAPFGTAAMADSPVGKKDSPPASRIKQSGAVVLAKTTAPDFGMLVSGNSSLYGIVRNPWDTEANPGGSSAGAAAGLAAGIGYGAVGTDLAGSVRIPASHCGLVGFKPTQGRVAHTPANSVRSPGAMARNVADAVAVHNVIAKPDGQDKFCLPACPPVGYSPLPSVRGLRIGVLTDMGPGHPLEQDVADVVFAASELLGTEGARIERLSRPFANDPFPALDRTFQVRALAEIDSLPEERRRKVLQAVFDWAQQAVAFTASQYYSDLEAAARTQSSLQQHLSGFDYVITPVIPMVKYAAGDVGLNAGHPLAHAYFAAWFNQTGQPALSLCFGMKQGMPVGIQVVGQRHNDEGLLGLASWLERHRGFHPRWPYSPRSA